MVYDLLSNAMTVTWAIALFSSHWVTQAVAGNFSMEISRPSQFRGYSPGVTGHQFQAWNDWLPNRSANSAVAWDRPRQAGRAVNYRRSGRSVNGQVAKRALNIPAPDAGGFRTFGPRRNNGFQDWSQWMLRQSTHGPQISSLRNSVGKRQVPSDFQIPSLGNNLEFQPWWDWPVKRGIFGDRSQGEGGFKGSRGRSSFQSWNDFTKRFGSKLFVTGKTPFGYRKIVMDWLNTPPLQQNGKAFGSKLHILKRLGEIGG